ncbi:hypothetical protein N1031_19565 [Herbiconiux moechotypicola]|uniref:LytR family transcriptional regulator n=1 Tax=Herbiconiux moechotypicola TaxID=637393 RepID=A0ABN3E6S5_9MICO|nr:hypothetical protein [Herbiconiux moechotypicola]MCS5731961.1 hypothetical protein [Herbiconiux moechotypicola]
MPSTQRRRRSRRRHYDKYYRPQRPRLRLFLTIGLVALLVLLAGILTWAALVYK